MSFRRRLSTLSPVLLMVVASIVYYLVNSSFFIAKPSDTVWLSEPSGNPTLFHYMVWALSEFLIAPVKALALSTFAISVFLPITVFYLVKLVSGNALSSFSAGFLITVFPSLLWSASNSYYSSLLGLLFMALTIIAFYSRVPSPKKALLSAVFGLLASFSDPLSGVILFSTFSLYWILNYIFERKSVLSNCYPLIFSPTLALSFFTKVLEFDPPPTLLPLALGLLAFVIGLLSLLKDRKSLIFMTSWLVSSTLVSLLIHPTLVLFYLSLPLASSSYLLLPRLLKEAFMLKGGGEGAFFEVDVFKALGLALVFLLTLSSLTSSYNLVEGVKSYAGAYAERYGGGELVDALNWINAHTPENVLILAEHPLSTWITSYTGRPVLENFPIEFSQDPNAFLRSYDADTILNSNYEISNRFIRLRDWGEVAPQRCPSFSSSTGKDYVEFLYLDENHATVKYVFEGKTLTPDFYQYSEKQSVWVDRSADKTILQHTYTLEGQVSIVKTLTLSRSPQSTIEYNISSQVSSIQSFSLKLWIPWERKLGFTQVSGNKFQITLDSGEYEIEFYGNLVSLNFGPDEKWSQPRVHALFSSKENRVDARVVVRVLNAKALAWADEGVRSASAKELLAKYKVAYAVIPTAVKRDLMDRFGLDDRLFKSQYENSKLTVYKVLL